jgi:hypothetical protein
MGRLMSPSFLPIFSSALNVPVGRQFRVYEKRLSSTFAMGAQKLDVEQVFCEVILDFKINEA